MKALQVDKNEQGEVSANLVDIDPTTLPEGDVTVAVDYSTINYKDGLVLGGLGGLVRHYPHIPGIDFSGKVLVSQSDAFKPGDEVVLTGWRVGENHWGGYGALLAATGYEVEAVTGRASSADHLRSLGVSTITPRSDIETPNGKPLNKEKWAGCVDSVGGAMLANILTQMQYGTSVAAIGLAGGAALETTVIPFLLRGVNLLGIDSVMCPANTRNRAWQRLATDLPMDKLESMIDEVSLTDVPALGPTILGGKIQGRTVVKIS